MPKQMPSHRPTRAVDGRAAQPRGEVGSSVRAVGLHRAPQDREPAAAEPVRRRQDAEPGLGGQRGDRVDADDRPSGTGAAACRSVVEDRPARRLRRRRPAAPSVDDDPAAGREQLRAARREQRDRVAADADVAVGEQRGVPAALAGQRVEDVAAQGATPRAAGSGATASAHDVDAERDVAGRGEARVIRPGPQPMSRVGPSQWPSTRRSAASAVARPAADRQRRPVRRRARRRGRRRRAAPRRRPSVNGRLGPSRRLIDATCRSRPGAANRLPGAGGGHRVGVRDGVDVAQRGAVATAAQPALEQRRRVSAHGRRAWTSARRAAAARRRGSRSASTHQPPSSAGPSTASCVVEAGGDRAQQRRR